jgi:hypothetical protein
VRRGGGESHMAGIKGVGVRVRWEFGLIVFHSLLLDYFQWRVFLWRWLWCLFFYALLHAFMVVVYLH